MYAAQISIPLGNYDNQPFIVQTLEMLLRAWSANGQILGREHPVFLNHTDLLATVIIAEEDSLSEIYNTDTINDLLSTLKIDDQDSPDIKIVGISPYAIDSCVCENPESLILYTNYASQSPPVRCGNCSLPIPLYKIAPEVDGDRLYLTNWQLSYQSCDTLHVNSIIGEQFSQRQVVQHDSPLSKEGREICKRIEEHTGKPTYYYLSKPTGKSLKQEKKRTCPSCKKKWLLKEPWHDIFDFKCEPCRLVSNIGWSVRQQNTED